MNSKIVSRSLASVILCFVCFSGINIIKNEMALQKFLFRDDYSIINVNKIFGIWNYYESQEKVAVGIFNKQLSKDSLNFDQIEFLANSLLKSNPRSAQAYYFKTVCSERKNNLNDALAYIRKAISLDPLNTTYLMGLAVLQINTNEIPLAEKTLERVFQIDPYTKNLQSLNQTISDLKNSK